jgi:hypothetical protein
MSTKQKSQLGSNKPPRDLDDIAADIHHLERSTIFEKGALLAEAQDACDHGAWLRWLEDEFAWSHDTAMNYIAGHELADKFRTVRNLMLPASIIYELGGGDLDDPDLPAIIAALAKATEGRSKPISVVDANNVIFLARARREYGNYPDAALAAMKEIGDESWGAQATAALKAARPTTEEAAAEIIRKFHRVHVASLYAPYGKLPEDVPAESLWRLEQDVPEDRRERALRMLQGASRPLTDDTVGDIARDAAAFHEDADDEAAGDEDPQVEERTDTKAKPEPDARDPDDAADVDADDDQAKEPPRAEVAKLVKAWVQASPEAKRQFVRERWDEIARARKQLDANGGAAEKHWIEGDTL